jgi:hypothetical protein
MRNKNGFTPREAVYAFVISTLHQHVTQLPPNPDNTPAFNREWDQQAKKLHDSLLEQSKLEGMELSIPERKLA